MKKGISGKTVKLKLRTSNFETFTRQISFMDPVQLSFEISEYATKLLEQEISEGMKFRLLGVGVSGFGPDQSYQAVKKLTKLKKYDHVVFHFFADNDLGDLLRNRTFIGGEFRNMGYCFPQKNILDRFLIIRVIKFLTIIFI